MSLEGLFAVVGGYLLLNESLSGRGALGCLLMLCGTLISQIAVARTLRIDGSPDVDPGQV